MNEQDNLLGAIGQTYHTIRTDPTTGEVLPVDVVCKNLLEQICTAYAIPPDLLGELSNANHMSGESQTEIYKRMLFRQRKGQRQ